MAEEKFHRESVEGVDAVMERMWKVVGRPLVGYAQAFDVSESSIKNWRSRGRVSRQYLEGFAKEHGVTIDSLLYGENESGDSPEHVSNKTGDYVVRGLPSDFVLLPRHDVRAGAGGGQVVLNDRSVIDHLAFKREWITHTLGLDPRQAVLIEVHGDSMQPTLSDGDLILVDLRNGQPGRPGVYVIQLSGHLQVKRLVPRLDGSVDVKSDNQAYGSEHLARDAAEALIVIGRVVWSGGKI